MRTIAEGHRTYETNALSQGYPQAFAQAIKKYIIMMCCIVYSKNNEVT